MGIYNTLDDSINRISTIGIVIIIVVLLLAIVLYIAQALFLNKFNKYTRGKSTWQAWVPIANLYLLGDLTFNNIVGWILVILSFIKPESLNTLYNFVIVGFYIYAVVKYIMLKREEQQSAIPKMVTAASALKVNNQVKKAEVNETQKEENKDNPTKNFTDKLKHFSIKKQKEEPEQQPQEYQSQQPMSAPKEENKSNFDFTSQPKQNYNDSSDSLQSLYNRK